MIQGGVLSPSLFLINFNDLLVRLKEADLEIAAYADDLVIIGEGKRKVRKAMKIIDEWVELAQMKINKKKSGLMYLRKNRRR